MTKTKAKQLSKDPSFKASDRRFYDYMRRRNLSLRSSTTKNKHKDNEEERVIVMSFIKEVNSLI